jgi:hypothetical protein
MYSHIYIYSIQYSDIIVYIIVCMYIYIYNFHIFKICGERIQSALLAFLCQCMEHGHDPIQRRISKNPAPLNPRDPTSLGGLQL